MANPAREARDNAQARWPGASVFARGRKSIIHQHPSDPTKKMLDVSIGPLHIEGTETEIDTAWMVGDGAPYRRRMLLADYHAFAGLDNAINFDAGQIVRYVHPASGKGIAFQPQSLDWTNDLNQIQPISQPLQVGAVVNDDTLTWLNAYGNGLDFHWQTQTARLQKRLVVNALGNLPTPNATILSGGNPVLRLPIIFEPDSGVDIYVGGVLWNRNTNNPQTTSGAIEFRLSATGQTLWYFRSPFAFDNSPDPLPVVSQRIRRSGNSLFVEVRVPWSWLQTAVYPVVIDPTIDPTVGADADDGKTAPSSSWSNNGNVWAGNYYGAWNSWHRYTGISGLSGVTIDVSYQTFSGGSKAGSPDVRVYAERADAPTAPTSTSDYNSRTVTTAYAAWGASDSLSPSSSLNSPLQELVDNHDPSTILMMEKDNGSASNENAWLMVNYGWGQTTTLHIEYTAGGGLSATVNQISETDAAQAVAKSKAKAVGQNAETDLAQSISPARLYAVAQASETDTAQAVASAKVKALGQAEETESAQTITPVRVYAVGQVTESDTAQAVSVAKALAVGQVEETDEAQAVASAKAKALGQAEETDSAQAFGATIVVEVGQVAETDSAFQVSGVKYQAIGQVTETDAAQTITPVRAYAVGQVSETDEAQAVASAKAKALGQASETDSALAFGTTIYEAVGQASETDNAQTITPQRIYSLGIAVEADSVFAFASSKRKAVGQAMETDSALGMSSLVGVGVSVRQVYKSASRGTHVSSVRQMHKSEDREADVL